MRCHDYLRTFARHAFTAIPVRKLIRFAAGMLLVATSAASVHAQAPAAGTAALTPLQRQQIIQYAFNHPEVMRFLAQYANQISDEQCFNALGVQACREIGGGSRSLEITPIEGPHFAVQQDGNGNWTYGAGADGRVGPPFVGAAGGATVYRNDNVEVCGGVNYGLQPLAGGTTQRCLTFDAGRFNEAMQFLAGLAAGNTNPQQASPLVNGPSPNPSATMPPIDPQLVYNPPMDVIRAANGGSLAANPSSNSSQPTTGSQASPASSTNSSAGRDQLVFDESNQQRADTTGSSTSRTNSNSTESQPSGQAGAANSPTQQQFRAELNQLMQQFQQAAARNQADILLQRSQAQAATSQPASVSRPDAPATVQPSSRPSGQVYAPRNGYDEYGNRADSPRRQYDDQGYYIGGSGAQSTWSSGDFSGNVPAQSTTPAVRQNRVYSSDGTSRPIGGGANAAQQFQAMQRWSQQQIAQQSNTANYGGYAAPVSQNTASTPNYSSASNTSTFGSGGQNGNGGPSAQLVFDDNAPRGQTSGSANSTYNNNSQPNGNGSGFSGPAVAPRTSGTQPNTANLGPAVSTRSIGVQPQTAGLQFP